MLGTLLRLVFGMALSVGCAILARFLSERPKTYEIEIKGADAYRINPRTITVSQIQAGTITASKIAASAAHDFTNDPIVDLDIPPDPERAMAVIEELRSAGFDLEGYEEFFQ